MIKPDDLVFWYPMVTDSLIEVSSNNLYGFIDLQGKIGIKTIYDNITEFEDGNAIATKNGVYYVIDKEGNETKVNVDHADKISAFSEGYAMYEIDDKYGFIGVDGNVVIKAKYDNASRFSNGLAVVRINLGFEGFINCNEEFII